MIDENKFIAEYLNVNENVSFAFALEQVLDNPDKFKFIKILDKYDDDNCNSFIIFSFDSKIYKVEYWCDSYGEYDYYTPTEVQRKTKEVVYYE